MDAPRGKFSRFKAAARKLAAKLRPRSDVSPPRWPNLAPPQPIPTDPAEHAVDFSLRWYDCLGELTRKRLAKLGIPRDQIGALDQDFDDRVAAFHPKERTGGGISPGARINLNSGIFNPELLAGHPNPGVSSIWERARSRDRFDAVAAHEFHEGRGMAHEEAERRAAEHRAAGDRRRQAYPACHGGKGTLIMLHNLTIGHLDTGGIERERRVRVLRPLEMEPVNSLLAELGGQDAEGRPTLDRGKVEIEDGYIVCPWRIGGYRNRAAERFAIRLQQETGCVLADREHSRIVDAAQFAEREPAAGAAG